MVQSSTHEIIPLDADFQTPQKASGIDCDFAVWYFPCSTRVTSFEIEGDANGEIHSIQVAQEEQLIDSMPIATLTLGPLMMPVINPSMAFRIHTKGFTGRIRPIGKQVISRPEQHTVKEVCGYIDARLQMAIANAARMGDFNDIALPSEVAGMLIKTGIAIARQYNVDKALLTNAVLGAVEDIYRK